MPIYDDVTTFSGESFRGVTVLSGGFPCQPFSSAGKRKGKEDSRYLFPEMLRVINESKPTWIIGENVANLTSFAEYEEICLSLESSHYEVFPLLFPASSVGAPHGRDRLFTLAHASNSVHSGDGSALAKSPEEFHCREEQVQSTFAAIGGAWENQSWNESIEELCELDDGIPTRMDRWMRIFGNSIVPQQIYPIFKIIADIENGIVA